MSTAGEYRGMLDCLGQVTAPSSHLILPAIASQLTLSHVIPSHVPIASHLLSPHHADVITSCHHHLTSPPPLSPHDLTVGHPRPRRPGAARACAASRSAPHPCAFSTTSSLRLKP
jgi:hypothetical protein